MFILISSNETYHLHLQFFRLYFILLKMKVLCEKLFLKLLSLVSTKLIQIKLILKINIQLHLSPSLIPSFCPYSSVLFTHMAFIHTLLISLNQTHHLHLYNFNLYFILLKVELFYENFFLKLL